MIVQTKNSDETAAAAQQLAAELQAGDVILLRGEMGAGKTVFAGGLCRALGVQEYVTSPTFTVVNEYEGKAFPIFHFDMYRIEDEAELLEIGFDEYLQSGAVCIIEWPQNVESSLPHKRIEVKIEKVGENERKITIERVSSQKQSPNGKFKR